FRQYAAYLDLTNGRTDAYFPLDYDAAGPGLPGVVAARFSYSTPDWWFIGTQATVHRTLGAFSVEASLLRAGQILDADRRVHASQLGSTGNPADDAVYDFIAQNFFAQADQHYHVHDFNYLPTLDCDYALTEGVSVGAKYERAARLGGIWFNPARGTQNAYHDEISENYDVYVRASAFDDRFTIRANVFYAHIRNQQMWVGLSSTPYDRQVVNAQRSHNDGVEVEATWSQGGLEAWLSAGVLEARFDRIEVGDANFSGNDFPDAPPWTVSTGLTYVAPRGWFAEIDATARPQTRGDLENHPWVTNESRQIVNARLGWTFARFEASLFARNLLDDRYLDYHDAVGDPVLGQFYIPGDPREIGMTVSVAL
ncbi:MAG TPA: TonB-dependent receptor, partial [Pseudomonadales bacterium]|nr:TonB-dependent receptor [Pseudomonadales bacterium]